METSVHTKQEVVDRLQRLASRFQALGVKKLGLFGSFVREVQDDRSDVDVLVEFTPGCKSFDNFMQLSFLLEETLQRRVEVLTSESLSPYIGPHILDEVEYVFSN